MASLNGCFVDYKNINTKRNPVLAGNSDDFSIKKNRLPEPIVVKLIRIMPIGENLSKVSLRVELYGCGEGETTTSQPLTTKASITESTTTPFYVENTTTVVRKTTEPYTTVESSGNQVFCIFFTRCEKNCGIEKSFFSLGSK